MKNKFFLFLIISIFTCNMSHSENKINITIDGSTMSVTLADNEAAKALIDKLAKGPVEITMNNYGGFEKVGSLPWSLPSSDIIITTKPGDIMLYTSNNMVIFYGENTWAYTPLGILETTNASEISSFVGTGNKQVTISLDSQADIPYTNLENQMKDRIFTIDGKEITDRPVNPGLYIVNNKKVYIKK